MLRITIDVECSKCGEELPESRSASASDARLYAASEGWSLVTIHGLDLDFCPTCQQEGAKAMGA